MKTFEILYKKKDGSLQRTEWIHKSLFTPMKKTIGIAIKRAEFIDMAIVSIKRID